ncbi:MAG: xylose isomerase, partial [Planctomycetota bacterium]
MKRREFFTASTAVGTAMLTAASSDSLAGPVTAGTAMAGTAQTDQRRFKLKYAPHFNMFKNSAGDDLIDQLKFASDQGFTAWEDNGMKKRSVDLQTKIGSTMEKLGMQMGVFVAHGSIGKITFARKDKDVWDSVVKDIRDSIEVAKRVNAKWMTVVPGNV